MLDIVCSDGTYDEDKENIQAFTHCPMCKRLCVISSGDKDKNNRLHKYGICVTCWRNVFPISNSKFEDVQTILIVFKDVRVCLRISNDYALRKIFIFYV